MSQGVKPVEISRIQAELKKKLIILKYWSQKG